MRHKFSNFATAATLMIAWSTAAFALTQVERSFSQLVDLADTILVGTVGGTTSEWGQGPQANEIFSVATLRNLTAIKGNIGGATYDFRYIGGQIGDVVHSYEGLPPLVTGTRYLLFISSESKLLFPTIGIGQGVFIVTQDSGTSIPTIRAIGGRDVLGIENDQIRTTGGGKPLTFNLFLGCIEGQMMGSLPEECQGSSDSPIPPGVLHPLDCGAHLTALVCHKFHDDESVKAVWRDPGSSCVPEAIYDVDNDAGRLEIGSRCSANSSGDFRFDWPRQSNQLWIQFRYLPQSELLTEPATYGVAHYKVMVTWSGTSSCSTSEFAEENIFHRGYHQWYEACGSVNIRTNLSGGDFDLQPGGDTVCHYLSPTERPAELCQFYRSEWATITYHLDLNGAKHGGQRWVDGWIRHDGDILVHALSFPLTATTELEHVYFGPYMSDKDSSISHPQWRVWYQDILVTTSPLL